MRRKAPTETLDPHLLRERAKDHIRKREWERALKCLDKILQEPEEHPIGEEFVPNKQSLVIRGRVKLILCHDQEALQDSETALTNLEISDPVYPKALLLKADTLYQMGKFEHALVQYHRGYRVKESDDFRLGIQKATEAIQNCLKNVKKKIKVDVCIDDTSRLADRQTVVKTSFVFPKPTSDSASVGQKPGRGRQSSLVESTLSSKGNSRGNFCSVSSRPFQKDVIELKQMMSRLRSNKHTRHLDPKLTAAVANLTAETLGYVKERNVLWIKQDVKQEHADDEESCEFDGDNLSYLEDT